MKELNLGNNPHVSLGERVLGRRLGTETREQHASIKRGTVPLAKLAKRATIAGVGRFHEA